MPNGLALRNIFLVLRHGHSVANQQGLIVSDPEVGIDDFGLSGRGNDEVRSIAEEEIGQLRDVSRIYASDFLRSRQTAAIVSEVLGVPVEYSPMLRERRFGDWEGTSNENYRRVWARDAEDASHSQWNVESVAAVAERMTDLVTEIEQRGGSEKYLLVSHGDPLQILIAAAEGIDLRLHREIDPLETAELRRLESGARSP